MNKSVWLNTELDVLDEFQNENFDLLVDYSKDHKHYLQMKWDEADSSEFQKMVKYGKSLSRRFEKYFHKKAKQWAIYQVGTLAGTIETFDYMLYEKVQDDKALRTYKQEVMSVKHLDAIVKQLEIHGVMSHSELCRALELKESTLSEVMKKADATGLILSSRAGKYKLYRLTEDGRRLGKQLRKVVDWETADEAALLRRLEAYYNAIKEKEVFAKKVHGVMAGDEIQKNDENYIRPGDYVRAFYRSDNKIRYKDIEVLGIEVSNAERKKVAIKMDEADDIFDNVKEEA